MKTMKTPSELYQLYVDSYSLKLAYEKNYKQISESDLLDLLTNEMQEMVEEEGSLENYADASDPEVVMHLFSIDEAKALRKYLLDKSR